ncbi:hypothetical protein TEQG_06367 [Trichophyton equinum CBS 127.97]|uniref:Uncharacterized protein n=1 Tax=Trichophyton equinum (strain ATCC MYA-4606 / CBS 127.97) TaxID=559882 RepID=F2PZR5_TRIEC|nr:hypothetical protein TEQG_06367 [Trichophyton equinum CBS 127.97]
MLHQGLARCEQGLADQRTGILATGHHGRGGDRKMGSKARQRLLVAITITVVVVVAVAVAVDGLRLRLKLRLRSKSLLTSSLLLAGGETSAQGRKKQALTPEEQI